MHYNPVRLARDGSDNPIQVLGFGTTFAALLTATSPHAAIGPFETETVIRVASTEQLRVKTAPSGDAGLDDALFFAGVEWIRLEKGDRLCVFRDGPDAIVTLTIGE